MRVGIIGTGYVGLCTGAVLAEIGHEVCCVDCDEAKISTLQNGRAPIFEPGLQELIDVHSQSGGLRFSTDIAEGVAGAEVVIIAVGTPRTADGEPNMVYVESVSEQIARNLDGYKVIVEKSTVPVQTGEWIKTVLARNNVSNHPFDVVSNPEFLREGHAIVDSMKADRIVIGTDSPKAAGIMRELYGPILDESKAAFVVTDIRTAELIKHASNAFLATKISFINAIANICERCGADVRKVAEGMGYDNRIGPSFLKAGIGYGGSCFPKDTDAFIYISEQLGYDFELLKSVRKVNDGQRELFVKKIRDVLWNLEGKRIAVWGLSYKPMTDDLRNSPSIDVIRSLIDHRATVVAYDPVSMDKARKTLPEEVLYAKGPLEAAEGAECVALITEWDEFLSVDLGELKRRMRYPVLVDGRNVFERGEMERLGFVYQGIGA
ncbi:MAG: UDP-glucose/GDP-mannose dehydrogenase family protein [Actinobacteria bacterium]|nr:MAG: UDP-glucose/GDP-mannose dehydrogenase family protein [Actinomycetota bacterium]